MMSDLVKKDVFNKAQRVIAEHEGLMLKPYADTVGKMTIGYGRNLDDRGINQGEADLMLKNDVADAIVDCMSVLMDLWDELTDNRQVVLIDMMFTKWMWIFLEKT